MNAQNVMFATLRRFRGGERGGPGRRPVVGRT